MPENNELASRLTRVCRGAAIFGSLAVAVLARDAPGGAEAIRLEHAPLLFVDDSAIAARHGVVRTIHPARTRPAPVLEPDRPWEGVRVYTYGSVHRDPVTGIYQLWYMSRSQEPGEPPAPQLRQGGRDLVLYATSSDGLHWDKPALGLHEYRGSKENNIVTDFHSPAVVEDRFERDPAKRLKMLGYAKSSYFGVGSADGINWQELSKEPLFQGSDTLSLTQNPRTGEFLAFFKKRSEEVPGRVVWLTRSRDFLDWSEPKLVFHADEEDNRWVWTETQRTEVYNMSVVPHATGYIGFPTLFRIMHRVPSGTKVSLGQSRDDGPIDVQMVTSADGENWARTHPRGNVIPRGAPGTFDGGAILGLTSTAAHMADETWMLYTALNTGHGGAIPPKRLTIGRATWRLHGFASLDAGPSGGRLETRPLLIGGGTLLLNADASRGQIRVALREATGGTVPGFGFEEFETLQKDATRAEARWKSGRAIPSDRPLRVLVELVSSRLYSLAGFSRLPGTMAKP